VPAPIYSVEFTAVGGAPALSGSKITQLAVEHNDPPILTTPRRRDRDLNLVPPRTEPDGLPDLALNGQSKNAPYNLPFVLVIKAAEELPGVVPTAYAGADSEAVVSVLADIASSLPAGNNASFAAEPATQSGTVWRGTLVWTPTLADVRPQPYDVTFTVANSLMSTATLHITVVTAGHGTGTIAAGEAPAAPFSVRISPNPFNPETAITYNLQKDGPVSIRIYSLSGRLVKTLKDEFGTAGTHEVRWNGTDNSGKPMASGLYFVKTEAGSDRSVFKVSLLK
jgi:hypothetical protein